MSIPANCQFTLDDFIGERNMFDKFQHLQF